jgi:hypothetical protein
MQRSFDTEDVEARIICRAYAKRRNRTGLREGPGKAGRMVYLRRSYYFSLFLREETLVLTTF